MTVIEKKLGVPRSTLSGWFKEITLTEEQQVLLRRNSAEGLIRARKKATEWHRNQKALRLLKAKKDARLVLDRLEVSSEVLDLAFAMLYLGEGNKKNVSSIANSDPKILLFVLAILRYNYNMTPDMVKCGLHLRADQEPERIKKYWSDTLNIPVENFRSVSIDKRTADRKTYPNYKGVCVLYCGNIAIQRKLIYLYSMFCDKVSQLDKGG